MDGSAPGPDRPLGDADELTAHLRAAARELIAAGRVLLDAAERLVDEPGAASAVVARWAARAPAATARTASQGDDHREEDRGLQHIDVT